MALLRIGFAPVAPEGEGRDAQDDADQDERQRDVQHDAEPRERRGEAREEQHDREDQPYVVRLPHRPDGVRDQVELALFPRARRQQGPHAAAEVRAREYRVGIERREDDEGEDVGETHVASGI